ncbi:hypothetical protein CsatB_012825 [Cannabis sativa]
MSSFCRTMELKNCCNTNINGYERIMFCSVLLFPSGSRWKMLWTKIMKEKKKFFECTSSSSSSQVHVPYDFYTYSQNFDQGPATYPENVSRSFSARFAVPSRIFQENEMGR